MSSDQTQGDQTRRGSTRVLQLLTTNIGVALFRERNILLAEAALLFAPVGVLHTYVAVRATGPLEETLDSSEQSLDPRFAECRL